MMRIGMFLGHGRAFVLLALLSWMGGCGGPQIGTRAGIDEAVWHVTMLAAGHFDPWCKSCVREHPEWDHMQMPFGVKTSEEYKRELKRFLEHFEQVEYGAPYHVCQLIEMGADAAPVLIGLLYNDTPTGITYYGDDLTFAAHRWFPGPAPPARNATLGDLANYALHYIFRADMGYRSYLSAEQRKAAIEKWRRFVQEHPRGDLKDGVPGKQRTTASGAGK